MEKGSTGQRRNVEPRLGQIVFATPRFKGSSPSLRTPLSGQRDGFSEVPLNDDEAERRQRRRDNHTRSVMSPGCHTPKSAAHYPERHGDSGTSSFSNAEITDHYSVCIKLSAENKINSKNAFGLHLIDWMSEVLRKRGEMTNFQVAGCTLDASAKIYAGRVDSIYNDAFKMLGGFGRSEAQDGGGEEVVGEDGERVQQGGRKKGKRNTGPNAQTIEKDPKSLNVNTFDMEFEVDPLFKKISTAIDEEGIDGMLLNQIGIDSDGCGLMLDASKVPSVMENKGARPNPQGGNVSDSVTEIKGLLQCVKDLKICPTFSEFKFNGDSQQSWTMQDLLSSPSASNDYCPKSNAEYSMVQQPSQGLSDIYNPSSNPSVNGADYDNDDYQEDDYEPPTPGSDVAINSQALPVSDNSNTILGTCGDARILSAVDPMTLDQNSIDKSGLPNLISGELCLMENIEISEYSYFKPQVLSAWAGPQHWKLRPRNKETDPPSTSNEITNKEQPRRKKQQKKMFRVDFTKPVSQDLFKKGRCNTVMSQAIFDKLSPSHITLPHDPHTNVSILYQLFTMPKWKIKRKKLLANVVEEPLEGEIYKYDNPTDNAGFTSYADDVGDDNYDNDPADDLDDVKISGRDFMSLLADSRECHDLAGDNLVSEPRKVTLIQIDYAKHAKRMDVKKIKTAMWDVISSTNDGGIQVHSPQSSSSSPSSSVSFTSLYSEVLRNISPSMAKEMSVSISFVCLLHLANEKSLSITDKDDMLNLFISQTEANPRN